MRERKKSRIAIGIPIGSPIVIVLFFVVCEFGEREEFRPIVLLVIATYVKILFQHLIETFGLSVTFWVITQNEMDLHI